MKDIQEAQPDAPVMNLREVAALRFRLLREVPASRTELTWTFLLFGLLLVTAFPGWYQRWALPESAQMAGLLVPFLTAGWVYLYRYRWILPELDIVEARFTDASVVRFLLEEPPAPPRRLRWLLLTGALLLPVAYWSGEPLFTLSALLVFFAGYLAFRHGTHALRVFAFPLLFCLFAAPLPVAYLERLTTPVQSVLLKIVTHLLQIVGIAAEDGLEGNPIRIPFEAIQTDGRARYEMFAGRVGTGIPEFVLFVVLAVGLFALLDAAPKRKIGALCWSALFTAGLLVARLILIAGVAKSDLDTAQMLGPFTLWIIAPVGVLVACGLLRWMKSLHLNVWAIRGLTRPPARDAPLTIYTASPKLRQFSMRCIVISGVASLLLLASASYMVRRTSGAVPLPNLAPYRWLTAVNPPGAVRRGGARTQTFEGVNDNLPPVRVSVAGASGLDALLPPSRVLLDTDGAVYQQQEAVWNHTRTKQASFQVQLCQDHQDTFLAVQWFQQRGGAPLATADRRVAMNVLLRHAPVFVLDIWADARTPHVDRMLRALAEQLSDSVAAGNYP